MERGKTPRSSTLLPAKQPHTPLISIGHIWNDLINWARQHMGDVELTMADAADFAIPSCVENMKMAITLPWQAHP